MVDRALYIYPIYEGACTLMCLLRVTPVTLTLSSLANIVAHSCLGSGLGAAEMVAFVSGSLVRLCSSHCPDMQSSQGLIRARESASKLTHGVAGLLWLLPGC